MRWIYGMRARLRLLARGAAEERMEEELRFHLEMETDRYLREGMSPTEARRRAVLAFGGVEGHKEVMRDGRTLAWLEGASLDLRLGVRMLSKHRGMTLIGGFAMAVAIAVGAVAFEGISAVLATDIPLDEGERVVSLQLGTDNPGNPERRVLHDFASWRAELQSVEQVGAFRTLEHNVVRGDAAPEPIDVAEMTASGFRVARVAPLLGRYLVDEDEREGAPPVVVIGYEPWQRHFGGDLDIVGRTLQLGNTPHVVVGVMPEGFRFPLNNQYWTPLRADPARYGPREGPALSVFGRLAPGATRETARAELATLVRRAAAAQPEAYERVRPLVLPYTYEHFDTEHPLLRLALRSLQLLVGGLLVVVAVNLAILQYARTVTRQGEIALRSALGASRRRILAQLFLESLVLALIGAAAGLVLAEGVLNWAAVQFALVDTIPFWVQFDLSPGTVLYALALAVLAATIIGVVPGLKATETRLYSSLRELGGAGPGLGRVWTSLIVAQVAIAVAILPLAVFTVWQVVRAESAELGFSAEEMMVGWVGLNEQAADATAAGDRSALDARYAARQAELTTLLAAEPGVVAVAYSSAVPGVEGVSRRIELERSAAASTVDSPEAGTIWMAPGLFEAYDVRIVAGRTLDAGDLGGASSAVVVNRAFVRKFLRGHLALGQRLRFPARRRSGAEAESPPEWHEIVGVVEDFPAVPLGAAAPPDGVPNVYLPAAPGSMHPARLSVRLQGGIPAGFIGRMREIGLRVDPELQLDVRPLTELYGSLRSGARFMAWAVAVVTATVLLLSAAGIYALMSFTVAQRTREIGIRAALGAYPRRILGTILGRVARQLAAGVLVGMLVSAALFASFDLGLERSAGMMAAVAAIMLLVGMLAAVGPARRGLRIQPMEALRDA